MIPKNNCPSNIDVHNGYQSFGTKYADFQDISIIQHHSLATVGFFQYKFYLKGQNGKDTSLKKDLWCQSPSFDQESLLVPRIIPSDKFGSSATNRG